MTRPNFRIVALIPRFDNRDVIVGYRTQQVEVAETLAWANYRLNAIWERDDLALSEISLEIRDADGCKLKPVKAPRVVAASFDDFPF